MTELLRSAITEGSRKTYARAWRMYVDFATDFGEPDCSLLPVSVNSLALFISYLSTRKFAFSTILTYDSALSCVHKLREQLQNAGPLLKVYIGDWLAGSAVAVVLEERGRYERVARRLAGSAVALCLKNEVDILESGSAARRLASGFSALRTR